MLTFLIFLLNSYLKLLSQGHIHQSLSTQSHVWSPQKCFALQEFVPNILFLPFLPGMSQEDQNLYKIFLKHLSKAEELRFLQ